MNTSTIVRLADLGLDGHEIDALHRIERTLHRWAELECGDGNAYASWSIERDEKTEKPYLVTYPNDGRPSTRRAVADRETGALKRLAAIMATHPGLVSYHQSDPRGCVLYILRASDLADGAAVDSVYTRGVAVA